MLLYAFVVYKLCRMLLVISVSVHCTWILHNGGIFLQIDRSGQMCMYMFVCVLDLNVEHKHIV